MLLCCHYANIMWLLILKVYYAAINFKSILCCYYAAITGIIRSPLFTLRIRIHPCAVGDLVGILLTSGGSFVHSDTRHRRGQTTYHIASRLVRNCGIVMNCYCSRICCAGYDYYIKTQKLHS